MSYNNFENSEMFSRNAGIVILESPMIFIVKGKCLQKKKAFAGNVSETFYV